MSTKLMRRCAAVGISFVAVSAPAAIAAGPGYCDPLGGGCQTHHLKVSPSKVKPGKTVTLHGTVGHGCHRPGQVTIYSRAFKGATRHRFAGVPAVYTVANKHGTFSTKVTIKRSTSAGRYHVGGRCGGGNFGSATVKVT
jgi:hypothetical protein